MSQENLEIVQRAMDAYNARDLTAYLAVIADSVRFRSRFSAIDSVIYTGHADMRRSFANLDDVWSRYEMQLERMVAAGNEVAALCHLYAVGRDSDIQLEEHPGVVFTVEAGMIVAMDSYQTHAECLRRLGYRSSTMRFSINIPNFGDFADAEVVAKVASATEAAGWDALFVWDHIVYDKRTPRQIGDPWMLLTAAAQSTTRIKIGTLVTPVPRRRPQQLARQVATLDNMSGGRVIFGAGLGGPIEDEYGSFGEPTDPRLLAEQLDEGLDLLDRYWSGEPVTHEGRHYEAREVTLLPTPVQRPRVPVWIGGFWPARRPMRRAARWDGAVPLFDSASHGRIPPLDEVRELVTYVSRHRDGVSDRPFEMVLGGPSPTGAAAARDLLGPLIEAGATWWDERRPIDDKVDQLEPVLGRIEAGPPPL